MGEVRRRSWRSRSASPRPDGVDGAPLPALEFVAFNGEEYLPVGDDEYLRRREGRLDDVAAAVNLDGVGLLLGATTITTMSPGDEYPGRVAGDGFDATVRAVAAEHPGVVWVDPWPESNHSTFAMRGVPSVALSTTGAARVSHYSRTRSMGSPRRDSRRSPGSSTRS